jgi:hypothetical protein
MGERDMTFKQRRFAELLASGCSKVEAFRRAYPSDQRGKGTEWEGAKRVARLPKVAAEVERLTLLRSPHDAAAQAGHIAARLLELTKNPDPSVALRAIAQWGKLAEAGLLKPPHAIDNREKDRLVDELMTFYSKKSAGEERHAAAPLLPLTPEPEGDDQVIDVESTLSEPDPISVAEDPSLRSLLPPTDQDRAERPVLPEVPEETGMKTEIPIASETDRLAPRVKLEPVPGFFPQRFRRVRG